jgi:hypothetical protein
MILDIKKNFLSASNGFYVMIIIFMITVMFYIYAHRERFVFKEITAISDPIAKEVKFNFNPNKDISNDFVDPNLRSLTGGVHDIFDTDGNVINHPEASGYTFDDVISIDEGVYPTPIIERGYTHITKREYRVMVVKNFDNVPFDIKLGTHNKSTNQFIVRRHITVDPLDRFAIFYLGIEIDYAKITGPFGSNVILI